jgi:alkylglycerol monooxygenase
MFNRLNHQNIKIMDKLMLFIPLLLLIVYMDWVFSNKKNKKNIFTLNNTFLNLIVGSIQQLGTVFSFFILLISVNYIYTHFRIYTIPNNNYTWILAYVAIDFVSYWIHRLSHRINILWAAHITHHSSSYFNLSNSFRTSPFQDLNRIPFWLLLAFVGFDPKVLFAVFIISSIIEFFTHTQNFPKIKWLEYLFVTPSLHKVHHGKNAIYLDKNYGSTLIIWDKLFGTFQDETEQVQFGIVSNHYIDNDPIHSITYYYKNLYHTMRETSSIKEKVLLWIMPPEWTPATKESMGGTIATILPKTTHSYRKFHFGIFTFIYWLIGVFLVLLFKKTLMPYYLIPYSFYGISNMIDAHKILFQNISNRFWQYLKLKTVLILVVSIALYLFFDSPLHLLYGIILMGSHLLSLMLFMKNYKIEFIDAL